MTRPRLGHAGTAAAVLLSLGCARSPLVARPVTYPADAPEQAALRPMQSDLRNLATAQEAYFAEHTTYAAGHDALAPTYRASPDVTVVVLGGDSSGWAATARHTTLRDVTCRIRVGTPPAAAAPWAAAQDEGKVVCVSLQR